MRRIWNPKKACYYSMFLTPAFGTALHALNWHFLGRPWAALLSWLAFILYLAVHTAMSWCGIYLESTRILLPLVYLAYLILWSFTLGAFQENYVANSLDNSYIRRSFLIPGITTIFAIISMNTIISDLFPPPDADEYIRRGILAHENGQFREAIRNYDKAKKLNDQILEATFRTGLANMELNHHIMAISDFDSVILKDPSHAEAYYYRGKSNFSKGFVDRGKKDYKRAMELNPELRSLPDYTVQPI